MLRAIVLILMLAALANAAAIVTSGGVSVTFGAANPLNPNTPGSAWIDFANALYGTSEACVSDLPALSSVHWVAPSDADGCVPQTFLALNETLININPDDADSAVITLHASWSASRFGLDGSPYGADVVADVDADPRLGTCGWILTTGWTDPADPLSYTTSAGVFAADTGVYAYTSNRYDTNTTSERAARRIGSKSTLDVMATALRVHLDEQPVRAEWFLRDVSVFNYTRLGGGIDRDNFELYSGPSSPPNTQPAGADALRQWSVSFACGLYLAGTADAGSDQPDTSLVTNEQLVDACITSHVPHQIPSAAAGSVEDLLFGQGATANLYSATVDVSQVSGDFPDAKKAPVCVQLQVPNGCFCGKPCKSSSGKHCIEVFATSPDKPDCICGNANC